LRRINVGEYFTSLSIPANTPVETPAEKEIIIEGEILSEIAYLIPPGWSALARFAIFYGIKQIYPEPEADWVTGDDVYRPVPITWRMPESKLTLTIKGYNTDDTYAHGIYIWLLTKPEEEAKPWKIIADFVAILKRLMGIR